MIGAFRPGRMLSAPRRACDDGIIAQGGDGFQAYVAGTLHGPLVVRFEPDDGGVIREDTDDVGSALDLAVAR